MGDNHTLPMKITRTLALALVGFVAGLVHAQDDSRGVVRVVELKGSLDPVVNWASPFELTPGKLEFKKFCPFCRAHTPHKEGK